MQRNLMLVAAALAVGLTGTVPALAKNTAQNSAFEPVTLAVQYDDLDLSSPRGRERLETRIRSAANSACGTRSATTLSEKRDADKCRKSAIARTQPEVMAAVRAAALRYAGRPAE
jgi:UrcA family protein